MQAGAPCSGLQACAAAPEAASQSSLPRCRALTDVGEAAGGDEASVVGEAHLVGGLELLDDSHILWRSRLNGWAWPEGSSAVRQGPQAGCRAGRGRAGPAAAAAARAEGPCLQDVDGGGAHGVAADLVARKLLLVQQGHLGAALGHVVAAHGAGGACGSIVGGRRGRRGAGGWAGGGWERRAVGRRGGWPGAQQRPAAWCAPSPSDEQLCRRAVPSRMAGAAAAHHGR